MEEIREPKQKRAILKKEKIIDAGFKLICKNGYYNTNTAQIASYANVSTGIIYQYFEDKHDILLQGLEKYGEDLFFPMLKVKKIDINNFDNMMKQMIDKFVKNHKISKVAHEEITAMIHSDKDVAKYFYEKELQTTKEIKNLLIKNNFKDNNLTEKVHIVIGMIDNLCHEIIYHKHISMDYNIMCDIIINTIKNIFKNDLKK